LKLVNSEGWLRYIGNIKVTNEADAAGYLANGALKSYEENGFGSYLIELKKEKKPIGMCSIIKRKWLPVPDLGYALLAEYMGKGYAYEAAERCMTEMFDSGHTEELAAIVSPHNNSSIQLLEKLQFQLSGNVVAPDSKEELLQYFRRKSHY
jgi:ribosomal-protein-alanine N-acetyltransferase